MSIYGSVVFNESYNYGKPVITDTIESIMEDDSIVLKDENEDFVTEGLEAVAVMTENYSNFMQRVGISELSAIYATGDEMIYTEGVVGDFFGGIKKFLMKIWDKIKSLFKRFIMVIDSYTKNDKAFINKYRQQIYRHKSLSDFTFKGYKYVIKQDKIEAGINKITTTCSAYLNNGDIDMNAGDQDVKNAYGTAGTAWDQSGASKIDEKHDDRMEKLRGAILDEIGGKTGAYTSEEYRKEIDELLRNGESEKQDLDDKDIDVDEMVTEVQNNRDTKKTYDRLFRDSKKSVDQNIKDLDRLQRDHIKNNMPSKDEDLEKVGNDIDKDSPNLIRYANNILKAKSKNAISSIGALNHTDEPGVTLRIAAGDNTEDQKKEKIAAFVNANKNDSGDFSRSDSKRRAAYLNNALKVTRATKEMLVTLDSCVLKALKDRNRQFKACLVKIAYHNPKNESSFTESYDYGSHNNYNFISNIQFK